MRIHLPRKKNFKSSRLRYASKTYTQYQVAVKLLGSFRLTAGNRHLHRYCIFTELIFETVPHSLHYSSASELTRQGISLNHSSNVGLYLHPLFSKFGCMALVSCEPCCGLHAHYCALGSYLFCVILIHLSRPYILTVPVLLKLSYESFRTLGPL